MKAHAIIATALHNGLFLYLRYFPLQKGKQRLLDCAGRRLLPAQPVRRTRLKVADLQMECDLRQYIQRRLYFLGDYEPENLAVWMKLARDADIVFDVGANVGLYSLAAAAVNPRCAVHAFEPSPEIVDRLHANIRLNALLQISVNPIAVGEREETLFLHLSRGSEGDNEGMNYVSTIIRRDADLPVPVTSLDAYCRQHGIVTVNLLKMDIEGHEYRALLGANDLLQREAIHCIFLELNSWAAERSGHDLSEIVSLLRDCNYHFYEVLKGRLSPMADPQLLRDGDVVAIAPSSWPAISKLLK